MTSAVSLGVRVRECLRACGLAAGLPRTYCCAKRRRWPARAAVRDLDSLHHRSPTPLHPPAPGCGGKCFFCDRQLFSSCAASNPSRAQEALYGQARGVGGGAGLHCPVPALRRGRSQLCRMAGACLAALTPLAARTLTPRLPAPRRAPPLHTFRKQAPPGFLGHSLPLHGAPHTLKPHHPPITPMPWPCLTGQRRLLWLLPPHIAPTLPHIPSCPGHA